MITASILLYWAAVLQLAQLKPMAAANHWASCNCE